MHDEDASALRPVFVPPFQAPAEQVGLPVVRLDDLRRTSANLALRAGVPLEVVSEQPCHSQAAITAGLHPNVEEQVSRDAARGIADVLDSVTRDPDRLARVQWIRTHPAVPSPFPARRP